MIFLLSNVWSSYFLLIILPVILSLSIQSIFVRKKINHHFCIYGGAKQKELEWENDRMILHSTMSFLKTLAMFIKRTLNVRYHWIQYDLTELNLLLTALLLPVRHLYRIKHKNLESIVKALFYSIQNRFSPNYLYSWVQIVAHV